MSDPPKSPPPNSPEPVFLWLRRADQWFLGGLLGLLTLLLGMHAARLHGWGFRGEAVQILTAEGYLYTLDINHATWVEWAQLDGIGETLARRIVQDRLDHGQFAEIEDVSRVKGIGKKTMDRIRPHLRNRNVFTVDQGGRRSTDVID